MAFTIGDGVAIIADVGIAYGLGRVKFFAGGPVGSMLGGALASAGGRLLGNSFDQKGIGGFADGVLNDAIWGGLGAGAGYGLGRVMVKRADGAQKAFTEAEAAVTEVKKKTGMADAEKNLKTAEDTYKTWEAKQTPVQQPKGRHHKTSTGDDERRELELAKDQLGLKEILAKRAGLDEKLDVLESARKDLDSRNKWAAKFRGEGQEKGIDWNRMAPALGSGSGVGLGVIFSEFSGPVGNDGSGDGANKKEPSIAPPFSLVWVGAAAAEKFGLNGTRPFVVDFSIVPAGTVVPKDGVVDGFLLQPEKLNTALAAKYGNPTDSLAYSLAESYHLFGDMKKKSDLKLEATPKFPAVLSGMQSPAMTEYMRAVQALNAAADRYDGIQEKVKSTLPKVADISEQGKANVANLISGINSAVARSDGSDVQFVDVLASAFNGIMGVVEDSTAQDIDAAKTILGEMKKQETESDAKNAARNTELLQNIRDMLGGKDGSDVLNPGRSDGNNPGSRNDGISDKTRNSDDVGSRIGDAVERSGAGGGLAPVSPAVNPNGLGGLGGMGFGGMDPSMMMMMQMLQDQAMRRQFADSDLDARRGELDRSGLDRPQPVVAPAPAPVAPPAVGTTPWSSPSVAQPVPHDGVPGGASSSQSSAGGGLPVRVPGPDGSVVYPFPDGRTQKVSLVVAQVLDEAFANKSGTDAQAAYRRTDAKWSDWKKIGERVGSMLMTGDVVVWLPPEDDAGSAGGVSVGAPVGVAAPVGVSVGGGYQAVSGGSQGERTAVLVVFGSGETGTVEIVVNGELQQYVPDSGGSPGEFGEFAGFFRPRGIELGAGGQEGSAAQDAAADQSAGMSALAPALTA